MSMDRVEAVIDTSRNVLIYCFENISYALTQSIDQLQKQFCGQVIHLPMDNNKIENSQSDGQIVVYLCGNIDQLVKLLHDRFKPHWTIRIVQDVSELDKPFDQIDKLTCTVELIQSGQVPLIVGNHNIGVYFRRFFQQHNDYFDRITHEHTFQALTESNKSGEAFRTGIYLTSVMQDSPEDPIQFHLLRCSSNLKGPTDNFRTTDHEIVGQVNRAVDQLFRQGAELNHVLAQVYHNSTTDDNKSRKAKIKAHSDKTKDMPSNGLIAFATFYDQPIDQLAHQLVGQQNTWTKLRFRPKSDHTIRFDVLLEPNSLLLIPLSTNRLYTHEIVPSSLPVDRIPTRLGYVIRCSNTIALFKHGETHILDEQGQFIPLQPKNGDDEDEEIGHLKRLYAQENKQTEPIDYRTREQFRFSLNQGDYLQPIL